MTVGLVGQDQISTFVLPVNGASPVDANTVRGQDNTIKTAFNTHDADATIHFQSSLNAARPAAATAGAGAKWIDNDTYRIYYSDGSAWHETAYLSTAGGTVAGNMVVSGTLGITGVTTATAAIVANGGISVAGAMTPAAGAIYKGTATGVTIIGQTGVTDDFSIFKPDAATVVLHVPVGTVNVVGAGTFTGTRLIGGTDIASAIAPGTFSDGTAPANNAYSSANVFSLLVSKTQSATTGSVVTSEVYHKQTGANAAGSTIAFFSYIDSAHTSGTTLINIANVASVEATGNGGTTTTLGCYRTQAVIGTGATVTTLPLVDIRPPANSGTITTLVGLDVQTMSAGATNYAIRTHAGLVQLGDALEFTAAATPATGTNVRFGNAVQSTIGANGSAIALTANPLGYLVIYVGVLKCIIPYYTA